MRTSFDKFGHSRAIESADRKLKGFLTLFAKLPEATQAEILEKVAELKEKLKGDPEKFIEEVRALAKFYQAVGEIAESTPANERVERLTFKLSEVESARK